ncbi:MAG TPA: hypothetical protein VKV27_09420 [Solirubrobacteraceae bacterium]|nr:hypothetical protein [Solirubrobacteraceae bacterium]
MDPIAPIPPVPPTIPPVSGPRAVGRSGERPGQRREPEPRGRRARGSAAQAQDAAPPADDQAARDRGQRGDDDGRPHIDVTA